MLRRMRKTSTFVTRCASEDRKSTRLNSSHPSISYAVFCLKKKKTRNVADAPVPAEPPVRLRGLYAQRRLALVDDADQCLDGVAAGEHDGGRMEPADQPAPH